MVFLSILFFSLSRILILTSAPYMSDTFYYHELIKNSLENHLNVYKDFFFAYPWLSWILVKMPFSFSPNLSQEAYRNYFHIINLLCECFFLVIIYVKTPRFRKIFSSSLLYYSIISLSMKDLIYDRVDLFLTLSFFSLFLLWCKCYWIQLLNYFIGFSIKIIPIALLGFKAFEELYLKIRVEKVNTNIKSIFFIFSKYTSLLILIIFCFYLTDILFFNKMSLVIFQHFDRGIQIESTWASFYFLKKLIIPDFNLSLIHNFGSYEINPNLISSSFLSFSKISFFVFLFFFFFMFYLKKTHTVKIRNRLNLFLIFILSFLCFQKILSVQFFVWLLPFIAIDLSINFHFLKLFVVCVIYLGSYLIFSINYYYLTEFNPLYLFFLCLRNLATILLLIFYLWTYLKPRASKMSVMA